MSSRNLAHVEEELTRIGLLLQHDRELASVTTLVAGGPIKGSWWGHPLGHDIFRLLGELELGHGALSAKIVNGKITYVDRRLWQPFLMLVQHGATTRARTLSALARSLQKRVVRDGVVQADELAASGFATKRELAAAARELEERLLVHADSVHTESGAHAKVLQTWERWASSNAVNVRGSSLEDARAEFAQAVNRLRQGTNRPKVPLLDRSA